MKACVVVPQHKFPLKNHEDTSLQQLMHFLGGKVEIFLLHKESMPYWFKPFGMTSLPVEDQKLSSELEYNRLMLEPWLYRELADRGFTHFLLYQLDCLVFAGADELEAWCEKDFSYVAAPWQEGYGVDPTAKWMAVGNGGFSLRRINDFLEVINSPKFPALLDEFRNGIGKDHEHEDMAVSFLFKKIKSDFKIPTPEEALPFSFEVNPEHCFRENGNKLGYGCHGWMWFSTDWWKQWVVKGNR